MFRPCSDPAAVALRDDEPERDRAARRAGALPAVGCIALVCGAIALAIVLGS